MPSFLSTFELCGPESRRKLQCLSKFELCGPRAEAISAPDFARLGTPGRHLQGCVRVAREGAPKSAFCGKSSGGPPGGGGVSKWAWGGVAAQGSVRVRLLELGAAREAVPPAPLQAVTRSGVGRALRGPAGSLTSKLGSAVPTLPVSARLRPAESKSEERPLPSAKRKGGINARPTPS